MCPSVSSAQSTCPKVLIVDDDASALRGLARLIRSAGYEVRTFSQPRSLLEAELPVSNACLIVDVNMPEVSGPELCEALIRGGRSLPVIFISGRGHSVTKSLTKRVPSVAVLSKPCNEDVLLSAVAKALKSACTTF